MCQPIQPTLLISPNSPPFLAIEENERGVFEAQHEHEHEHTLEEALEATSGTFSFIFSSVLHSELNCQVWISLNAVLLFRSIE